MKKMITCVAVILIATLSQAQTKYGNSMLVGHVGYLVLLASLKFIALDLHIAEFGTFIFYGK